MTRNEKSHLLLFRTPKDVMESGVTTIVRGEGCRVYDQDGKSYLDMVAGITRPVHVGYGREDLARAIYDQAVKMPYFVAMGYTSEPAEELAAVLAELTPEPLDRFLFVCDGSEAVESALKLARLHHAFKGEKQRFKIVSRRGAYHGVTGSALRALGTVLTMRQFMEPLPPGGVFIESPYCYRCPLHLKYPDCDLACARDLARILEFEGPDQVSAFIGEPIQQGFGALAPPPEYWPIIREICDQYNILLIIDEVICGFGRTGRWFGVEHFHVKPDLMTMAKGISSGYVPLGAVGVTESVMAPIMNIEHLHTYGNHPVSCAAGLKNISIMKEENLIQRAAEVGTYLLEAMKTLEDQPLVGEVRGRGLWVGLDLALDKVSKAPLPTARLARLVARAKDKGLIIKMMGPALEISPPLIIERDEIDEAVAIIRQCLTEEAREG
jgi:putrescine---pyruvate transaminase